ncbi:MAG TPA: glycosyltransferase family 39 protein, partial [Acidimicrobiales bacterium]
ARRGLPAWALVTFALAGVVLRAYVLQSPIGTGLDADESGAALVSQEILDGDVSAFTEGLRHGGTALAYPRAVVLALVGRDALAMKLCEVVVFAAACLVVWRVGRRMFDERTGQIAAGVMWVFSPALVWDSTKVMLYYTPSVLLAALCMLLCLRLYQEARTSDVAWLGLLFGLSWWMHPMTMYAVVPAIGWLVATRPRLLLDAWRAVPTAVIGALPWLIENAGNGWDSLSQPPGARPSTYGDRLAGFFTDLLPRATGLRHQYAGDWYLAPVTLVIYAGLFVCVLVAIRRWHGERTMLLAIGLAYPVLFAVPENSVFVDEPRYAMVLAPSLSLGAAYVIVRVVRRWEPAVAVVLLLALVSLVSLRHVVVDSAKHPGLDVLRPADLDPIHSVIDERGIEVAFAEYWLGMRLAFEDEDLQIIPLNGYYLDLYDDAPDEGSDVALFFTGSPMVQRWRDLAASLGYATEVEVVDRFTLVWTNDRVPKAPTLGVLDQ